MNKHAQRASHLLSHYIQTIMIAAGKRYDSDNAQEIEEIVDEIMAAVDDEIEQAVSDAIDKHVRKFSHTD